MEQWPCSVTEIQYAVVFLDVDGALAVGHPLVDLGHRPVDAAVHRIVGRPLREALLIARWLLRFRLCLAARSWPRAG